MAKHKLEALGSRHPAINYEYADASERVSATGFETSDLGTVAWQKSDNTFWCLVETTPIWSPLGNAAAASATVLQMLVRKSSAGTIPKGSPCCYVAYNPLGYVEVEISDAGVPASMPALGIAWSSITDSADSQLIVFGTVEGMDTSSFSEGDLLYVSDTPGELSNIRPTGASVSVQKVASVLRSDSSAGTILVSGANRVNDLPNVTEGSLWVGNSSGNPVEISRLNIDTGAIHKEVASEISSLTLKGTPVSGDHVLIEDSADMSSKKRITIGSLPSDSTAIHKAISGEVSVMTSKSTLVSTDVVMIEDSADTWGKKKAEVSSIRSGLVEGPASSTDNAIARFDSTTGKLIQNSTVIVDDAGRMSAVKTATFVSVPTITPSSGIMTCVFADYQKIIGSLNNNASVTIQLGVPNGPGNYMLLLIQGSTTPTTTITWATDGTHALYAPGGSIVVQLGISQITLIGLFYDGSVWYAVPSSMSLVLAN